MNVQKLVGRPFGKFLCILLALAMATGPTMQAAAQQPVQNGANEGVRLSQNGTVEDVESPRHLPIVNDKTLIAAPDALKIDLDYVTPQAVALLTAHPRQLLTAPATAMLPVEVVSAAGLQQLGVDPAEVDEVVAFVEPPLGVSLPYGVVIKFSKPFELGSLPERLIAHTQPAELAGKQYLQSANLWLPSFFLIDQNTLLAANDATLRRMVEMQGQPHASPLLDRVGDLPNAMDLYAVLDVAALRPILVPWMNIAAMQQRDKFPEEAKPFLEVPNLISAIDLTLNITNPSPTLLALHANDAASADRLEELYNLGQQLQRMNAVANAAKLQQSDDPIERAFGKYIERMANTTTETYKYERRGDELILFQMASSDGSPQSQLIMVAVAGMLVALILPAIQAAREAARRSQSMNNMKNLMLSLHNYHDTRKTFPAHASYSLDDKPLLSWRVHVLPYLEEQALYNEFHLDEPCDSEHNRKLIAKMPAVFANPKLDAAEGKTNYLAVVGEDCIFDGSADGIGFRNISDGTSKTIALVEANADQAVEWTKPDDWEFDPKNPKAGIGDFRPGGCNAAFADGSVQFISNAIDPDVLKALFTRNGREVVDRP